MIDRNLRPSERFRLRRKHFCPRKIARMFYVLVFFVALTRLVPHPPNLVCVGALGLFAGCYLQGRIAWVVPVAAMLVSDIIGHIFAVPGMGFYSPGMMAMVYLGFACTALVGRGLSTKRSALRIGGAALASAMIFFVLSNLGVWLSGMYGYSVAGLVNCYTMAIPFFGNTLAGDLLYSAILFGTYELSLRDWSGSYPGSGRRKLAYVRVPSRRR